MYISNLLEVGLYLYLESGSIDGVSVIDTRCQMWSRYYALLRERETNIDEITTGLNERKIYIYVRYKHTHTYICIYYFSRHCNDHTRHDA